MGRLVWVRNKKTKKSETGKSDGWWPERKKLEAVASYLTTGNISLTGKLINVPRDVIYKWSKTDWWKERVQEIKDEDTVKMDKRLQKLIEKSLDVVNDRIESGDYEYDRKTGKLIRVPVKLRDVHAVSRDLIDRRTIIEKLQNQKQQVVQQVTNEDRLLKLAETFAQLALGKKAPERTEVNEVYEGDFESVPDNVKEAMENAFPTEWSPTVQTGVGMGTCEETEQGEGQGSEEQSESTCG